MTTQSTYCCILLYSKLFWVGEHGGQAANNRVGLGWYALKWYCEGTTEMFTSIHTYWHLRLTRCTLGAPHYLGDLIEPKTTSWDLIEPFRTLGKKMSLW